jgi:hypothetical protein
MRVVYAMLLVCSGCAQLLGLDPPTRRSGDSGVAASCASDSAFTPLPTQSSTYLFVATDTTWDDARVSCQNRGAHLVIIDDATELDAIGLNMQLWLGVSDALHDGVWRTTTGATASYLPWEAGQPSTTAGDDCVKVDQGVFVAKACDHPYSYACECEP